MFVDADGRATARAVTRVPLRFAEEERVDTHLSRKIFAYLYKEQAHRCYPVRIPSFSISGTRRIVGVRVGSDIDLVRSGTFSLGEDAFTDRPRG